MATPRRTLFWLLASSVPFFQQISADDGILLIGGGDPSPAEASIVGGTPSAYPFIAVKEFKLLGYCSAVLIHSDILMSAAHCYNYWTGSNVCVGANKLDCSDASEVILAERDYIHPNYYPNFALNDARNDIMLIKLASPSSAPVAAWNGNVTLPAEGTLVTAVGFGITDPSSVFSIPSLLSTPDVLQEVDLTVGNIDTCAGASDAFKPKTNICAYGDEEAGICLFDS